MFKKFIKAARLRTLPLSVSGILVGSGLAISEELVRGHGGTLELTSTGPEGTVFTVCLPKGDGTI